MRWRRQGEPVVAPAGICERIWKHKLVDLRHHNAGPVKQVQAELGGRAGALIEYTLAKIA